MKRYHLEIQGSMKCREYGTDIPCNSSTTSIYYTIGIGIVKLRGMHHKINGEGENIA